MRSGRPAVFAALVAVNVCLLGVVSVAQQTGSTDPPQMSETFFKNVQVLKGIPVDEFMDVMGMFSASLGFDCASEEIAWCSAPIRAQSCRIRQGERAQAARTLHPARRLVLIRAVQEKRHGENEFSVPYQPLTTNH